MPIFTAQQLDAIQSRGENLLVSAAAGSGKTAVLVERIVSLLKDGASIDRMLVVTYTRAAAAEMRERIAARIEGARDNLRSQANLLTRAQIKTLHSFCAYLLKQHFLEADLPPAFTVDAGPGLEMMRARAMEDTLDDALSDEETAAALARLGREYQYGDLIKRAANFLLCQTDPAAWANNALGRYRAMLDDFDASPYTAILRGRKEELLCAARERLTNAAELAVLPGGPAHYLPVLASDEMAAAAVGAGGLPIFERAPAKKADDVGLKDAVVALRADAKKFIEKAAEFGAPDETDLSRMGEMLPSLEVLMKVSFAYIDRYERMRVAAGRLDYSDLEHRTLRALKNPLVLGALRGQFDYIFVDEYQDANAVQEAILSAIARENNRFMVGDVKQSIYRFRLADPTIFMEKQRQFGCLDGGRRIDLNLNFRSTSGVLDAVNHVFSRAMSGGSGEIEYGAQEALYPGREIAGPPVEIVLIDRAADEADEWEEQDVDAEAGARDAIAQMSAARHEAAEVAAIVSGWIGKPLYEGGEPVRASDIAIVMRTLRNTADEFQRALEGKGIPVVVDRSGALLKVLEVRTFLDLLCAIDNRRRDIPLLGAMRAFGEFSPEELGRIRAGAPNGAFSDAAFARAGQEDALGGKVAAFLEKLLAWRAEARQMPLADFIALLLEQTRYEHICALKPNGEGKRKNLRAFTSLAARMPSASLGEFIDAVSLMATAGGGEVAVGDVAEDVDAVRILTIHKSKGLEYPVVIGCGLGRAFNRMDENEKLFLHGRYGLAAEWVDESIGTRARTAAQNALSAAVRRENLSEEARMLYVLMTRAREKLILTAAIPSVEKAAARWAAMGPGVSEARSMMDMIGPALIRHPDGAPLCDRLSYAPNASKHPARYVVRVASLADLPGGVGDKGEITAFPTREELSGTGVSEELAARLGYRPPEAGAGAPQKTSVTAAAKRERIRPPVLPVFLDGTRDTPAAQRGLVMHAALRALDFAALRGLDGDSVASSVDGQIERMLLDRVLTREQADGMRRDSIVGFLRGELGRAAVASSLMYREQPFNLRVDDGEAVRLMQGVIDLCFLNETGLWVVVDYKTDRYDLEEEAVRARHGAQLESYAHALEELTEYPVARKIVYLFHTGKQVEI